MPMLTTLRIGLPVWPFHSPERTRSAKAAIRSSTSWTSATTSTPSTTSDAPCGMRRATWSTERFSETLMRSPRNIASMRSARPDSSASCEQQPQRLVGDAVLGVVEVEAGALGGQALAAPRVAGEQVAQVPVARSPRDAARAPSRQDARCSASALVGSLAARERRALLVDVGHEVVPGLDEALSRVGLELGRQRVDVDAGLRELRPAWRRQSPPSAGIGCAGGPWS